MIPTVILAGILVARWWFVPVAAIGWAILILASGECGLSCAFGAYVFGFANALVGVLVGQLMRAALRATFSR